MKKLFPIKLSYENGLEIEQLELNNYYLDYFAGNTEVLVFTFEPWMADKDFFLDAKREAWGLSFLAKESFSVIGVKSKIPTWFRDSELHHFFRSDELKEFCQNFKKVVFYGGSMGGYGALTFADAFPESIIIAMAPQSSLSTTVVPWETRFKLGREQDWTGDFIDGRDGAKKAKKVFAFFDPFNQDRKHIDRLEQENLIKIPISFSEHKMPAFLQKIGLLKEVVLDCINDTFDKKRFHLKVQEKRRTLPAYFNALAQRTKSIQIQKYCVDQNLLLTSHEITNNDFIETMSLVFKHAIIDRNYLLAFTTATLLKQVPQRPRFIKIFITITRFYMKENRNELARRYLNSLDPSIIIKVSTKNLAEIEMLSKEVKSKLHMQLRDLK